MSPLARTQANRINALKSTGPRTSEGKQRSRINAVRHGLTAETVIGTLEDASDYQAFEMAITADYEATTAVERELVLRLASVLWRLRRATAIETALFSLPVEDISETGANLADSKQANVVALAPAPPFTSNPASEKQLPASSRDGFVSSADDIVQAFLRLIELPTFPLDRLSRYEHTLWRQARQLVHTLESIHRHGRHHSRFSFPSSMGRSQTP